jgi:hypothetical protein
MISISATIDFLNESCPPSLPIIIADTQPHSSPTRQLAKSRPNKTSPDQSPPPTSKTPQPSFSFLNTFRVDYSRK